MITRTLAFIGLILLTLAGSILVGSLLVMAGAALGGHL